MKKLIFGLAVISLFILGPVSSRDLYGAEISFAEDWTLGIGAGAISNQCDKNYVFGMPTQGLTDISIDGKDGWFISALLDAELNEYFSVGIESGYMQYDLDFTVNPVNVSGVSGNMGSMGILPFFGHIKLGYPVEKYGSFSRRKFTFAPHITCSVGGLFVDFDDNVYASSNGYSVTTESSALAFKYGAGLDFFISERIALNFEGSYLDADVKTSITSGGLTNGEDVKNNSWLFGGALKYSF